MPKAKPKRSAKPKKNDKLNKPSTPDETENDRIAQLQDRVAQLEQERNELKETLKRDRIVRLLDDAMTATRVLPEARDKVVNLFLRDTEIEIDDSGAIRWITLDGDHYLNLAGALDAFLVGQEHLVAAGPAPPPDERVIRDKPLHELSSRELWGLAQQRRNQNEQRS